MIRKLILLCLLLSALFVQAQKVWTLQQCVDYALDNNIELKQQELNVSYQKNELEQRKYDRLPNLNAQMSQNFGFGRSLDNNNDYVSTSSSNTGIGISSSVTLWNAGRLNKQVKRQGMQLKTDMQNFEKAKEDLKVNIAQAYLEILYAIELRKMAEEQLKQTLVQQQRTRALVQSGSLAEGVLLDIKSQAARERLAIVESKSNYELALLSLAQMLALEDYTNFVIAEPDLPEIKAESALLVSNVVYQEALKFRPEIKVAEFQVQESELQLAIAKTGYMPSLNASASYYDQYYVASSAPVNVALSQQIKDNGRSNVGLQLNIPLFSRMQNKTNVNNSKIQIESRKLDLEAAQLALRKVIEQAYLSALSSFERYHANVLAEQSMQESFRYMEHKFELGRVNSVEYSEAKTNLAKAQSDLIQAKYEFIFRSKILDFYKGVPIVL